MKRRTLSIILASAPAGFLLGNSTSKWMTDPSDRETWKWLLGRFGEKETIKMKNGKVALVGMTNKSPYDVGIMLDSRGRVARARFNGAVFTNDEWGKLAGFRQLTDLTCWHNFRKFKKGEPRPDFNGPHELSGEGLIAFRDHPLEALNIGGSTFNNLGLEAVAKLPNFRKIKAYHTRVDDEGLKGLAGNDTLQFLNVGPQYSMRITEASLLPIGRMKKLRELEFNETMVTWENGLQHLLPLRDQLVRVKLDNTWIEDGCLAQARKAFPKTTFEHSVPQQKYVDQMRKRAARQEA